MASSELQPARQHVGVRPAQHPPHLGDQRQRQSSGDPDLPALAGIVVGTAGALGGVVGSRYDRGAVAGTLDGRGERLVGDLSWGVMNTGPLSREIHAGLHAREPIQRLLDASSAGGAGHARDRQFDGRLARCGRCQGARSGGRMRMVHGRWHGRLATAQVYGVEPGQNPAPACDSLEGQCRRGPSSASRGRFGHDIGLKPGALVPLCRSVQKVAANGPPG